METTAHARADLGRHVYGAAAFAFGLTTLAFHDFDTWLQLRSLWNGPAGHTLVYAAAIAQIYGGAAIQWRRTAQSGAATLAVVYLFFALRWIPSIIAHPQIYDFWGNLFEQLSLVCGATIVYASVAAQSRWTILLQRFAYALFGLCVVSFTLEQAFYLKATAGFVPKWIPPGQMFWAIATTIAFALAAIALLSGRLAVLASGLLTMMIVGFGLLLWLPGLVAHPQSHINWAGNAENLAIAGAAWVVADFLRRSLP